MDATQWTALHELWHEAMMPVYFALGGLAVAYLVSALVWWRFGK
jgi:hypothetical protein